MWRIVNECLDELVPGCSCDWVPGHGRHEQWAPPDNESATAWREVNDYADNAASFVSNLKWTNERAHIDALETIARRKALYALLRTSRAETEFCGRWLHTSTSGV